MNVFITGGSGFIGTHLARRLLEADDGFRVTATGSRRRHPSLTDDRFSYLQADTTEPGEWQKAATEADLILNLAGRSIFRPWTEKYKTQMRSSRLHTTRNLVAALPEKSEVLVCSASAVGFYGSCQEDLLTETSPRGDDFLARLAEAWEAEALAAEDKGARVVLMRFGIVLGSEGGAIPKMLPTFRLGLGGPLGSGEQWFPWLHIEDLYRGVRFLMAQPALKGPINFTAPQPIRQAEMAKRIGRLLHRPAILPTPAFAVKLAMGELGETLLASQRVIPDRLSQAGFEFSFPEMETALRDILA
ncbi:MAG: TIGR01777 family oxidoreductase [Desulfosarcinaceae bacterium]